MSEQLAYFQAVRASLTASLFTLAALLLAGCVFAPSRDSVDAGEWPSYGNDPGGTRFSPLLQIDRSNVANLHVAWTYRTEETGEVASWLRQREQSASIAGLYGH